MEKNIESKKDKLEKILNVMALLGESYQNLTYPRLTP